MTSFVDVWENELYYRAMELKLSGDYMEIVKLICNMAYVEGSTDGYHRGREDAMIAYNKITNKLWPVGKNEDYGD